MEPLRILMVAARYFPFAGGIETHVHEVGRRLAARGHSVSVVTGDPSRQLAPRETVKRIEIIRVPTHPRETAIGAWLRRSRRWWRRRRGDGTWFMCRATTRSPRRWR